MLFCNKYPILTKILVKKSQSLFLWMLFCNILWQEELLFQITSRNPFCGCCFAINQLQRFQPLSLSRNPCFCGCCFAIAPNFSLKYRKTKGNSSEFQCSFANLKNKHLFIYICRIKINTFPKEINNKSNYYTNQSIINLNNIKISFYN